MADSLSLIIRTADSTRKNGVNLPATLTIGQLLQAAQQKWNLPATSDYAVRLERTGQQLSPSATLAAGGVQMDDVLTVFPIIEAGQK
ncbi:hypothetical protein [Kamptonema formosum]|uniref:hypothetical protein n=1 Tax=Kamptonema formosum TaxID=331992 RepID=UPI00034A1B3B|nr:hypothetical protein [Oscillatoria sp. PCC 10802]